MVSKITTAVHRSFSTAHEGKDNQDQEPARQTGGSPRSAPAEASLVKAYTPLQHLQIIAKKTEIRTASTVQKTMFYCAAMRYLNASLDGCALDEQNEPQKLVQSQRINEAAYGWTFFAYRLLKEEHNLPDIFLKFYLLMAIKTATESNEIQAMCNQNLEACELEILDILNRHRIDPAYCDLLGQCTALLCHFLPCSYLEENFGFPFNLTNLFERRGQFAKLNEATYQRALKMAMRLRILPRAITKDDIKHMGLIWVQAIRDAMMVKIKPTIETGIDANAIETLSILHTYADRCAPTQIENLFSYLVEMCPHSSLLLNVCPDRVDVPFFNMLMLGMRSLGSTQPLKPTGHPLDSILTHYPNNFGLAYYNHSAQFKTHIDQLHRILVNAKSMQPNAETIRSVYCLLNEIHVTWLKCLKTDIQQEVPHKKAWRRKTTTLPFSECANTLKAIDKRIAELEKLSKELLVAHKLIQTCGNSGMSAVIRLCGVIGKRATFLHGGDDSFDPQRLEHAYTNRFNDPTSAHLCNTYESALANYPQVPKIFLDAWRHAESPAAGTCDPSYEFFEAFTTYWPSDDYTAGELYEAYYGTPTQRFKNAVDALAPIAKPEPFHFRDDEVKTRANAVLDAWNNQHGSATSTSTTCIDETALQAVSERFSQIVDETIEDWATTNSLREFLETLDPKQIQKYHTLEDPKEQTELLTFEYIRYLKTEALTTPSKLALLTAAQSKLIAAASCKEGHASLAIQTTDKPTTFHPTLQMVSAAKNYLDHPTIKNMFLIFDQLNSIFLEHSQFEITLYGEPPNSYPLTFTSFMNVLLDRSEFLSYRHLDHHTHLAPLQRIYEQWNLLIKHMAQSDPIVDVRPLIDAWIIAKIYMVDDLHLFREVQATYPNLVLDRSDNGSHIAHTSPESEMEWLAPEFQQIFTVTSSNYALDRKIQIAWTFYRHLAIYVEKLTGIKELSTDSQIESLALGYLQTKDPKSFGNSVPESQRHLITGWTDFLLGEMTKPTKTTRFNDLCLQLVHIPLSTNEKLRSYRLKTLPEGDSKVFYKQLASLIVQTCRLPYTKDLDPAARYPFDLEPLFKKEGFYQCCDQAVHTQITQLIKQIQQSQSLDESVLKQLGFLWLESIRSVLLEKILSKDPACVNLLHTVTVMQFSTLPDLRTNCFQALVNHSPNKYSLYKSSCGNLMPYEAPFYAIVSKALQLITHEACFASGLHDALDCFPSTYFAMVERHPNQVNTAFVDLQKLLHSLRNQPLNAEHRELIFDKLKNLHLLWFDLLEEDVQGHLESVGAIVAKRKRVENLFNRASEILQRLGPVIDGHKSLDPDLFPLLGLPPDADPLSIKKAITTFPICATPQLAQAISKLPPAKIGIYDLNTTDLQFYELCLTHLNDNLGWELDIHALAPLVKAKAPKTTQITVNFLKMNLRSEHDTLTAHILRMLIEAKADIPHLKSTLKDLESKAIERASRPAQLSASLRLLFSISTPDNRLKKLQFPYDIHYAIDRWSGPTATTAIQLKKLIQSLGEQPSFQQLQLIAYLWVEIIQEEIDNDSLCNQLNTLQKECIPSGAVDFQMLVDHCPSDCLSECHTPFLGLVARFMQNFFDLKPISKDGPLHAYPLNIIPFIENKKSITEGLLRKLQQLLLKNKDRLIETNDKVQILQTLGLLHTEWLKYLGQRGKHKQQVSPRIQTWNTSHQTSFYSDTMPPAPMSESFLQSLERKKQKLEIEPMHGQMSLAQDLCRLASSAHGHIQLMSLNPKRQITLNTYLTFDSSILEEAYKRRFSKKHPEAALLCRSLEQAAYRAPEPHFPLFFAWWNYLFMARKIPRQIVTDSADTTTLPPLPNKEFFSGLVDIFPLNGSLSWTIEALEDAYNVRPDVQTVMQRIYNYIGVPRSFHFFDPAIQNEIEQLHRTYDPSHQTPKKAFATAVTARIKSILNPDVHKLIENAPLENIINSELSDTLSEILRIRRMRFHYQAYLKKPADEHVEIFVYEWISEIMDTAQLTNEQTNLLQDAKRKLIQETSLTAKIAEITKAKKTTFTPTPELVEAAESYQQMPSLEHLKELIAQLRPFLDQCQNVSINGTCPDVVKQWAAHEHKNHIKLFQIFLRHAEQTVLEQEDSKELIEAIRATYETWHQLLSAICQGQQDIDAAHFMHSWWSAALHLVDYLPLHLQLKDDFACIPAAAGASDTDTHMRIMRSLATQATPFTNYQTNGFSDRFHWDLVNCFLSHAIRYLAAQYNLTSLPSDNDIETISAGIFQTHGWKVSRKYDHPDPVENTSLFADRQRALCLKYLAKLILDYSDDYLSIQTAIATLFGIPVHDELKIKALKRLQESQKSPEDIASALRVIYQLIPPKHSPQEFPYTLTNMERIEHPLDEEHLRVTAYLWIQRVMTPVNEPELSMQQLRCLPDMTDHWLDKLMIHCPSSSKNTDPFIFGEPFLHLLGQTFVHYTEELPFDKIGYDGFDSILQNYPHKFSSDAKQYSEAFESLFKKLHKELTLLRDCDDSSRHSAFHTISEIYKKWLNCLQNKIQKTSPNQKLLHKKRGLALQAIKQRIKNFKSHTENLIFVQTINPLPNAQNERAAYQIKQAIQEGLLGHLNCLPIVMRLAQTTAPSMELIAIDPALHAKLAPFMSADLGILKDAYQSRATSSAARDLCEHYETAIAIYPQAHPPLVRAWWRYCKVPFTPSIPLDLPVRAQKPDDVFFNKLINYFKLPLTIEQFKETYQRPRCNAIIDEIHKLTQTIHPFHINDRQMIEHIKNLVQDQILTDLHKNFPLKNIKEYNPENLIGMYLNPSCLRFAAAVDSIKNLDEQGARQLHIAFLHDLMMHTGITDIGTSGPWIKTRKRLQKMVA